MMKDNLVSPDACRLYSASTEREFAYAAQLQMWGIAA